MALAALAIGCGANPQTEEEVAVIYTAGFRAEAGVQTEVVFPFPDDALAEGISAGLTVTDGGTATVKTTAEGKGLSVVGRGDITASFTAGRMKGLASGKEITGAMLTRQVPDAGASVYWFRVNKGGTPQAQVDFVYDLQKNCGEKCGAEKKWSYAGNVGLSLQQVTVNYTESVR